MSINYFVEMFDYRPVNMGKRQNSLIELSILAPASTRAAPPPSVRIFFVEGAALKPRSRGHRRRRQYDGITPLTCSKKVTALRRCSP